MSAPFFKPEDFTVSAATQEALDGMGWTVPTREEYLAQEANRLVEPLQEKCAMLQKVAFQAQGMAKEIAAELERLKLECQALAARQNFFQTEKSKEQKELERLRAELLAYKEKEERELKFTLACEKVKDDLVAMSDEEFKAEMSKCIVQPEHGYLESMFQFDGYAEARVLQAELTALKAEIEQAPVVYGIVEDGLWHYWNDDKTVCEDCTHQARLVRIEEFKK